MSPLAAVRILGAAVLALIFGLVVWQGNRIYRDAKRVPALEREIAQLVSDRNQLAQNFASVQKASHDYQAEIAALRAARPPATPVRLCVNSRVPASGSVSAAGRGPHDAPAAAGELQPGTGGNLAEGPDIGPDLRELARRADLILAQARGLQNYARACSAPNLPIPTR